MPYTTEWHPDLSALTVRYTGSLSAEEYRRMCAERVALLDQAATLVSVVMDMQALQSFPDALQVGEEHNVLQHQNAREVLLVLEEPLYERLAEAFVPDAKRRWPVRLFPSVEQALFFVRQHKKEA